MHTGVASSKFNEDDMVAHYILAGAAFIAVFILFIVVARTLNNIINLLVKLEYLVQKEYDLKKELMEVHLLMEDEAAEQSLETSDGNKGAAESKPQP
ncbi:MAG: hypothetical protein JW768_11355 [Chitinispirillaceae bacterium]|nr:hypothetical protein [Chitinispirillaceae bacterium]